MQAKPSPLAELLAWTDNREPLYLARQALDARYRPLRRSGHYDRDQALRGYLALARRAAADYARRTGTSDPFGAKVLLDAARAWKADLEAATIEGCGSDAIGFDAVPVGQIYYQLGGVVPWTKTGAREIRDAAGKVHKLSRKAARKLRVSMRAARTAAAPARIGQAKKPRAKGDSKSGYGDYTVTLKSGGAWTLRMNTSEPGAQIKHVDDEGDAYGTQYRTADARHSPLRAAKLLQSGWDNDDVVVSVAGVESESTIGSARPAAKRAKKRTRTPAPTVAGMAVKRAKNPRTKNPRTKNPRDAQVTYAYRLLPGADPLRSPDAQWTIVHGSGFDPQNYTQIGTRTIDGYPCRIYRAPDRSYVGVRRQ